MRVARVKTNETCNQNCGFCDARRPEEDRAFVASSAVRARIAEAVASGVRELVLTGGEPTLKRDLEELVAAARSAGSQVTLETNGALLDDARISALVAAGITAFRVHLPAWGAECDRITRDPGGFARTRETLRSLQARGMAYEIATPIVEQNLGSVAAIPAALAKAGLAPRTLLVSVPSDGPDLAALAAPASAARALEALSDEARRWNIALRIEQANPLPPCLLERPARHAHLYALTPGGSERRLFAQVAACGDCNVRDRCPGVPEAWLHRHPTFAPRPIVEDRVRRRLTVISSTEEQIARELVTEEMRRGHDGSVAPAHIVRIEFQCNQSCDFCFVSTHLPRAAEADILRAIESAGRAHAILQLSGGEPTLNPRVVEYVRLGYAAGAPSVEIQTNALRLADPSLTRGLVDAGLSAAFVSLHASAAALSDRITGAPGTFEKTVRGIDELARHPLELRLNFVFCSANLTDFPDYVSFVAKRWPRAEVTVSVAGALTDLVPLSPSLIPRYSDLLGPLRQGLERAKSAGLRMVGFESMCGMPLCLAPVVGAEFMGVVELPPDEGSGEFVKPEVCGACDLERRCFGVRRSYAELYGTAELRAVDLRRHANPLADCS